MLAGGVHDERYRSLVALLRDARIQGGLTQEGLARRLGQRQQFVSKYEVGERRLDFVELIDIARELNLDPADLVRSI